MKAGPARGLANGPVSAPSMKRPWPNRFVPVRYCSHDCIAIQAAEAASIHHRARRRASL